MSDNLSYLPVNDFVLVPDEIMEMLEESYGVKAYLLKKYNNEIFEDKTNHLFVIKDDKFNIKGFVFTTINLLEKILSVVYIVIDEDLKESEYPKIAQYLADTAKVWKLKGVRWACENPELLEGAGFEKSERTLMELNPKQEE